MGDLAFAAWHPGPTVLCLSTCLSKTVCAGILYPSTLHFVWGLRSQIYQKIGCHAQYMAQLSGGEPHVSAGSGEVKYILDRQRGGQVKEK